MEHHPGKGIFIFLKKNKIGDKSKILALIFFIFSKFRFLTSKFEVSRFNT
jgi:hypothetical protein